MALVRLVTAFALMLMPLVMTTAPAAAHAAAPAMIEGHCADHPAQPGPPATDVTQCMLMCAALPAAEPLILAPPIQPRLALRQVLAEPIQGIILEIATPPPRAA
jgi:hypothetical protein